MKCKSLQVICNEDRNAMDDYSGQCLSDWLSFMTIIVNGRTLLQFSNDTKVENKVHCYEKKIENKELRNVFKFKHFKK